MKERLIIDNFFSIEHFDWEIKDFNILTGEMASGKSLCLKLLYFVEQVFHKNVFFTSISRESLTKEFFYNNLSEKFHAVFHISDTKNDFCNTSIRYTYSYLESTFDLSAKWNTQSEKLEWNSKYINNRLPEWSSFFAEGNAPDAAKNVRTQIYERLEHDFHSTFPIGVEFIPASRAIAAIADPSDIPDSFLDDFITGDKPFVLNFDAVSDEYVNKILHLKNISANKNKTTNKKTVEAEALDGRKITPLEFSSGQQELLYLLLLIKNLDRTTFNYGKTISVFIEEPSAHLFPQEQKESIEYIVSIFRKLHKEDEKVRFFISTHSPYVLNVINNMLKKGHLMEKTKQCGDTALKETVEKDVKDLKFPHLDVQEISAHFIHKNVVNMINVSENGAYLYDKMIENISQSIENDYNSVKRLLRRLKDN